MGRVKRRRAAIGGVVLLALALALAVPRLVSSHGLSAAELKQAETARVASGTLKQRFALLSQRHTNKCSLASTDLDRIAVHGRLQGSCCRAMVYSRYVQQVRGLRAYAAVSDIPADPYDIPVSLARRLIAYDSMRLSGVQQATYDRAVKLSEEHGPCCCHCWRWHAFEGQAKALITRRRFTSAQIGKVWDLEDGCGGGSA
jgi:hypothetical protein